MDSGTPPKSCTNQAIGTINIVRNKFPPVIQPSQYATYINEALADGSLVFDLNATDQDSTVSVMLSNLIIFCLLLHI